MAWTSIAMNIYPYMYSDWKNHSNLNKRRLDAMLDPVNRTAIRTRETATNPNPFKTASPPETSPPPISSNPARKLQTSATSRTPYQ